MPRSLEQWLVHQSQVHPQVIDLGLARLQEVLERLNWRQPSVPVITVTPPARAIVHSPARSDCAAR